jgi:hypothetical protein
MSVEGELMTPVDRKIFFTALGFLAVIVRDVPEDKQALRAKAIARLIENFCTTSAAEDEAADATQLFAPLTDGGKNEKLQQAMEAFELCLTTDSTLPTNRIS